MKKLRVSPQPIAESTKDDLLSAYAAANGPFSVSVDGIDDFVVMRVSDLEGEDTATLLEQLFVRSGSFEIGIALVRRPDEKPVSHVRDVTLPMSCPYAGKNVHAVSAPQFFERLLRVLEHEVDDLVEFVDVPVFSPGKTFEVACKRGGVFCL